MESAFQAVFVYPHTILAQKTGTLRLRTTKDFKDRLEGKPNSGLFVLAFPGTSTPLFPLIMEPELVRSFSACLKSMRTWFDSTRFHLYRDTKTVSYSGVAFTCAGKSAERVSKTKQGRKKQALPSPVCRHGAMLSRAHRARKWQRS